MLYVVDGSYYIFRAFYAVRNMRNSKGMPTNGLYAFTNMLLNLVRDHRPDYLAIAFDPPGDVFRNRLYPEYKANRDAPPEDLVVQFPRFRDIVKALNIPVVEVPDFEADDVIGTMTVRAGVEGIPVTVLSGDKDLAQLVTETVTLYDSMRDKKVGMAEVLERFKVAPSQVADVLGLAGDTSDNIPGVPGIGEKTAGALIAEFGSVENVLANIDKVSGKKRKENLANFAADAVLSKDLATIRCDVPIGWDLDAMALTAPNLEAFDALCHEFEFRRFPNAIREIYAVEAEEPEPTEVALEPTTLVSIDAVTAWLTEAKSAGTLALVPFVGDGAARDATLIGLALSHTAGAAAYVPVGHMDLMAPRVPEPALIDALRPLLEDPSFPTLIHDAKWAGHVLNARGLTLRGVTFDALLAAYLVDPNRRTLTTEGLAREFLGRRPTALADIRGSGRKAKRLSELPVDAFAAYACEQADTLRQLVDVLQEKMGPELRKVHDEIELPLVAVLQRLEHRGIRIDSDRLARMSGEFHKTLEEVTSEVFAYAGHEFTINSPSQLATVLFEELGLPVKKKGKAGPSTDATVLEELWELHPMVPLIARYREISKLASTYVDALPALVRSDTGRLHTTFNQAVAATGRLSSSDPNLQNIPIRTQEGKRIREAFVPRDGWVLIGGDYSQIELRVLAHMCEDPVLTDAFASGEDIHSRTAAEVLEIPVADVSGTQRAAAKAINFGLIYGMGAVRLARETGLTRTEAKQYIERYFDRISRVKPFMDELVELARSRGYAETLVGRRRPIPELVFAESRRAYALGERLARNTPIQGTAADIIKIAMINVERRLAADGLGAEMLLTVHDELLFECPPDEVEDSCSAIREEMEAAFPLSVPLLVEFHSGATWAELK